VASCGTACTVDVYHAPYTTAASHPVVPGYPNALVANAAGDLFAGYCGDVEDRIAMVFVRRENNGAGCGFGVDGIALYVPPYTAAPKLLAKGVEDPMALALDGKGDLFVLSLAGPSQAEVTLYAAPSYATGKVLTTFKGLWPFVTTSAQALAVTSNGTLVIATGYTAEAIAAPYTGKPVLLPGSTGAVALATDVIGNVFVADCPNDCLGGGGTVGKYAPPYTGKPVVYGAGKLGRPDNLTTTDDNPLVVDDGKGTVDAFSSTSAFKTVSTTFGASDPPLGGQSVVQNALGELFVLGAGNANVGFGTWAFGQPYTGPAALVSAGSGQTAIALSPE
jgi:hypothetical protein